MTSSATSLTAIVRGLLSRSRSPVLVSMCRSSDHCVPGRPSGSGKGNGGLRVMANASGRFRACAKDEKFLALSPRPGRNMMALVGFALAGRWMTGDRLVGKSFAFGSGGGILHDVAPCSLVEGSLQLGSA